MTQGPYLMNRPEETQAVSAPDQICFANSPAGATRPPISHYFWLLRNHLWQIIPFIALCMLLTYILTSRLHPVYEALTTVEIDREPYGVVGQSARDVAMSDAEQFLSTQARIMQSDVVLAPVAVRFGLTDKGLNQQTDAEVAVKITKQLRVIRLPNTYLMQLSYRASDPAFASNVVNAIATAYLDYTFDSRLRSSGNEAVFMERQLNELRARREKSNEALQRFERDLNLINPEEKTNILSARLLQLNSEYTSAQADRVRKEAGNDSLSENSREVAETSSQGKAINDLEERLNQAQTGFAQIRTRFGPNHPEYQRADAEIQQLKAEIAGTTDNVVRRLRVEYKQSTGREEKLRAAVAATKAELDRMNSKSFQYQSLKQDADADRKLYDELEHRVKEAAINSTFHNDAVRVVDPARYSRKPVWPNMPMNLTLSFFASTLLAVAFVWIRDSADRTVRDPVELSRLTKADVIATLPTIRNRRRLPAPTGENGDLSLANLTNEYEESIRVLRSTIFLSEGSQQPRSLLVTSALPGEGKTTTALQLCRASAQQGRRTLLIDADLRRPSIHLRLDLPETAGLPGYLCGEKPWRELVVNAPGEPLLDILPTCRVSRTISDLAIRWMPALLDETTREYDLVVVDSQPLLGFSEPLQIAVTVHGVILLARAGKTDRNAVCTAVSTLTRVRANLLGIVLNQTTSAAASNSYYAYSGLS